MKLLLILLLAYVAVASAEDPKVVLDTSGNPLQRDAQYYIKPAITDNGGRFTLVNRKNSCPLFVGQEATSLGEGLPVKFAPFFKNDSVVREGIDFQVSFAAATICVQPTTWKLNGEFIDTGPDSVGDSSYFYIASGRVERTYHIGWCPNEACPGCAWFQCGEVGVVVEDGKRLLVWDANPSLPVVFERA